MRHTGYGVLKVVGDKYQALDCGVIKNPPLISHSQCLRRLAGGVRELVKLYKPDCAVLEGAFFAKNLKTTLILGYARGCVMTVLAEEEIPAYAYSPMEVKMSAVGYGGASKAQVAMMIGSILNLDVSNVADDATDALALALCHSQRALKTGAELFMPKEL